MFSINENNKILKCLGRNYFQYQNITDQLYITAQITVQITVQIAVKMRRKSIKVL